MCTHVCWNSLLIEFLTKITDFLDFGATFYLDRIFFIFFSYWRCVQCTHLSKTEFLAVVSKMAKLPQNVIFDICWILPIFGTVTSSFSMENRLLANFPYWNPDLRWPLSSRPNFKLFVPKGSPKQYMANRKLQGMSLLWVAISCSQSQIQIVSRFPQVPGTAVILKASLDASKTSVNKN